MIVGIKDDEILNLDVKVESNQLKLELSRGTYDRVNKFIEELNLIDFEIKYKEILNLQDELSKDEVKSAFKNFVLNEIFNRELGVVDFRLRDECDRNEIRKFKGESIDLVDNLFAFKDRPLATEVIEMIKSKIEELIEVDLKNIPINDKNKEILNWCIYLGNNEKYRGSIGKVVKFRERQTSHLVECPNKFKASGKQGRVWSNPKNLVLLNDVVMEE